MKKFDDIIEVMLLSKEQLLKLANNNKVLNLNELKKSINNFNENKRIDRLEFSESIDFWVKKGWGSEIGYADVHQFIIE